jgi:putative DNA primase/helicase
VLGKLAHRALMASNISSAALFRVIDEVQPTLLIDEADTFLNGRDELRGILNAGYTREGAYVVRVTNVGAGGGSELVFPEEDYDDSVASKQSRLALHSCWCPKVIAAIGKLPETLTDRCIVIRMQRKMSSERCDRVRNLMRVELQMRCAQFVREREGEICGAQPTLPACLNDRAGDIWEPLLAIAEVAGGHWPELARNAAVKLSSGEEEPSELVHLLKDLQRVFERSNKDRLFSRDIVTAVNAEPNSGWEGLRGGREINEWWLSQQLRGVGIRPRTMWIGGVAAKGYLLEDFEPVFARYAARGEADNGAGEGEVNRG